MSNRGSDWLVINAYTMSEDSLKEVIQEIGRIGRELIDGKGIEDFYYNKYYLRVKFGFHKPEPQVSQIITDKFNELAYLRRVEKFETASADLNLVDGLETDHIKCIAREVADVILRRFGGQPSFNQSRMLIHFAMNQICFEYDQEGAIYKELLLSVAKELRAYHFGGKVNDEFHNLIILADKFGSEFNSRYENEGALSVLEDLSNKLCVELDKVFGRGDPRTGQLQTMPMENRMWAINLIVSAWEGWLHQSKAIEHYGRQNPVESLLLDYCISVSKIQAIEQGKQRAEAEKLRK